VVIRAGRRIPTVDLPRGLSRCSSSPPPCNEDRAAHTATAERAGAFDTDKLERGDARAVTLDKPGTYRYYCVFHRFMQADLIVVE